MIPVQPQPQQQPVMNAYPAQKKKLKGAQIIKQGYMNKKGNWFNTAYKKRWFKLWSNKKMAYLTHPGASYTKGYCDFTNIKEMGKTGKHEMRITTSERVWHFSCFSEIERNEWFDCIQRNCLGVEPAVQYAQQNVQYMQAQPVQPLQQQQQPMYRGSVIQ